MTAALDSARTELTWWETARTGPTTPTILLVEPGTAPRRLRTWLGAGFMREPTWRVDPVGSIDLARGLLKLRDFAALVVDGGMPDVASAVSALRAEPRGRSVPIIIVGGVNQIARTVRVPEDAEALRRVVGEVIDGTADMSGSVELAALFLQADVPIVGLDDAQTIIYANLAAARALGQPDPGALLDRPALDVIPPEAVRARRRVGPGTGRLAAVWTLSDDAEQRAREARLFQAQRLVALGELTGGICHDFNNLLTAVIGNLSEVVRQAGLPVETREMVEDALAAAVDGANLTRRLGAKPTSGRPRAVDLGETLGDFGRILRRVVRREVHIDLLLDPDVSAVLDRTQLESAVMNLVLNAQHAIAESGKLRLVVRRDGDRAIITVEDDGAGMTPETLARATESFFTTRGDEGGTGLGLAMVDDFVRRFGGTLTLMSERGRGTAVRMTFPWVPDASPRTSMGR